MDKENADPNPEVDLITPEVQGENLFDNPDGALAEMKQKKKKPEVKYIFTSDATEALIEEWEKLPVLFDCSHAEYHVKEKRWAAVEKLRERLSSDHEVDPAASADDILTVNEAVSILRYLLYSCMSFNRVNSRTSW